MSEYLIASLTLQPDADIKPTSHVQHYRPCCVSRWQLQQILFTFSLKPHRQRALKATFVPAKINPHSAQITLEYKQEICILVCILQPVNFVSTRQHKSTHAQCVVADCSNLPASAPVFAFTELVLLVHDRIY